MSNDEQNLGVEGSKKISSDAPVRAKVISRSRENRSLVLYTIVAIGIALVVRFFIAAPYLVSGPSMEDTFQNHDYLIVDKFTYGPCLPWPLETDCLHVGDPQRGDVIVFRLPQNQGQTLIKRIIGLPGETVIINGTAVSIKNAAYPEGFTLSEPYISPQNEGGPTGENVVLGPDEYFVMGDNRKVSYDSRSWGTLPREDIIGRVFIRMYPFSDVGILPGEARYQ